jgi:hypothetical protein
VFDAVRLTRVDQGTGSGSDGSGSGSDFSGKPPHDGGGCSVGGGPGWLLALLVLVRRRRLD